MTEFEYDKLGHEPHQFRTPYSITADESHTYVSQNPRRRARSRRWVAFVCTVMPPILKVFCGFQIQGRKNLAKLPQGAVSVCNHVHPLDCVALAVAFWRRDVYFMSQRENFGIPVVRHLIRILKALPVPESHEGFETMFSQLVPEIRSGALYQVYPEGSLRTDCMLLRDFKPGAFQIAARFELPILPCTIRIIPGKHRKKRVLTIGEPIFPDSRLPEELRAEKLQAESRKTMLKML